MALNLARYMAHEEPGEPGSGKAMPVDEGVLFIAVVGGGENHIISYHIIDGLNDEIG